jgi:hypothetical protein
MIWSLETDDFLGKCHGEKYPLLTAINRVLLGDVTVSTITHSTLIREKWAITMNAKILQFFLCIPL